MTMTTPARAASVLGLAVLLSAALAAAADTAVTAAGDFDAALARAKAEDKPLIIDFYTDW